MIATSAGTSVIASTNAATSASMIVIAIGENVLPPSRELVNPMSRKLPVKTCRQAA